MATPGVATVCEKEQRELKACSKELERVGVSNLKLLPLKKCGNYAEKWASIAKFLPRNSYPDLAGISKGG
jgi:hypothetical protein